MKRILTLILLLSISFASQEVYTVTAINEKQEGVSYKSVYFLEEKANTLVFINSKWQTIEIQKNRIKRIYDSDDIMIQLSDLRKYNPNYINMPDDNNSTIHNNNIIKEKSYHFENNWIEESKMLFYQTEKISPEKALIYQALFSPIPFANVGYAYSNNWDRGIIIDGVDLVFRLAILHGNDINDSSIVSVGILGVIVSNVLKITECYRLAEKYNDNLYKSLFGNKRPDFSINYSIDNGPMLSMSIPIN